MIKILKNKVFSYISTRYLVYGIQFVSLMMVAEKLGPYNYAKWSFLLLLLSYMMAINFGIGNSVNVYLIQNKKKLEKVKDYIASAFAANVFIIVLLLVLTCIYLARPSMFGEYNLGILFYGAVIIGILQYINQIYINIYRARNYVFEVAFNQSIIPFLILISVLISKENTLIYWLTGSYLLGNVASLILYKIHDGSPKGGRVKIKLIKKLFSKGFFLFIYNSTFTLILTTTSSFVSRYYTVTEYGMYSFSYTLGHSILLLMAAFSYIILPKIIDVLYNANRDKIQHTLKSIRSNYVSLTYLIMYSAMCLFPFLIKLFSKYADSIIMLNMMTLSITLTTNSFGYNTYLIANNKEKLIAIISLICLLLNITVSIVLAKIIKAPYFLSVISMILSYTCFSLLCSWFANKHISGDAKNFITTIFPLKFAIPYVFALAIVIMELNYIMFVVLIIFIMLNKRELLEIVSTIRLLIKRPEIIDIRNDD